MGLNHGTGNRIYLQLRIRHKHDMVPILDCRHKPLNVKKELAQKANELGLIQFMGDLAAHFGPFAEVHISSRESSSDDWNHECGYERLVSTERIISKRPLTWLNGRKLAFVVQTDKCERFSWPEHISNGYLKIEEYHRCPPRDFQSIVPYTGY